MPPRHGTHVADRTRVFVYGSCVARDTFARLDPDRYELVGYVPRQSLITACRPPAGLDLDLSPLTSEFQRRVTAGALAGDLFARLTAHTGRLDLLLWDITDERLGVHLLRDGGALTRSVELVSGGLAAGLDPAEAPLVPFGSRQHRRLWTSSLGRWAQVLEQTGLGRTLLLAPPWAETTADAVPSPASAGTSARAFNRLARPYYRAVRRRLPWVELWAPDRAPLSDPRHVWGHAPFHFDARTYEEARRRIQAAHGDGPG